MTLLGELYANGLGVPQDDKKAAEWYKLAAARGDANAMFALAMFRHQGPRRPARPRRRAPNGSPPPPSSATRSPPTISRCSTSRASCSRRISTAPPNCCASPRTPATRKRNMRSAPSTRRAAACRRTCTRRCELFGLRGARRQYRRRGRIRHRAVQRRRRRRATRTLAARSSARRRSSRQPDRARPPRPHSRQRPGAPADPVEAAKWHLISKRRRRDRSRARRFREQARPATRAAGNKRRSPGRRDQGETGRADGRRPRPSKRRASQGLSAKGRWGGNAVISSLARSDLSPVRSRESGRRWERNPGDNPYAASSRANSVSTQTAIAHLRFGSQLVICGKIVR